MDHDPPEDVVKIFPWIDLIILSGLDKIHIKSRRPATTFAADEGPVFPSHRDGTHGIIRRVVGGFQPPVFQIAAKGLLLIQGIIDGLP